MKKFEDLNTCSEDVFINFFASIYDGGAWVAKRVFLKRPFHHETQLIHAFLHEVDIARRHEKMALLLEHPHIDADTAYHPFNEEFQLFHNLPSAEYKNLQQLLQRYKERYGFPCIYAFECKSFKKCYTAIENRLYNGIVEEFAENMAQLQKIAYTRLVKSLTFDYAPSKLAN